MKEFGPDQEPTTITLAEGEELNAEKLNAMKTALDDLQIIDVERKPSGLSEDLKASDEFVKNNEAFLSLQQRGFLPLAAQGEPLQIYSTEGEVTCATKDGVKYVLRFGNLADSGTGDQDDAKSDDAAEGDDKDVADRSTGPSRFLFVTAQFDESMIAKPEMQPLPGEEKPADEEKPAEGEAPAAEGKPAEEPKPEAAPAETAVPETKTAAQEAGADKQPAAAPAAEAKADDAAPAEDKPAEEKPAEPAKPATPEEAARISVEKENKRRQDEYDAQIKAGQDKVKELNERFADWYYIISDDVYKKIHLGRADIIKSKEVESKDVGNLKQFQEGLGQPAAEPAVP